MSVFSSVEEHDLQYEHELMCQKFTVVAGEFFGKWQTIELKPKLEYQNEYKDVSILSLVYLIRKLYSDCHPGNALLLPIELPIDYDELENYLIGVLKERNIRKIMFPMKNVIENRYEPTILYIISSKEMCILQEKMCRYILSHKHNG